MQYVGARSCADWLLKARHVSPAPLPQFSPGPGNHAITVSHLYSMYHRWGDVILTTVPLVAKALPLPSRPVSGVVSTTKVSPLVQPVRTRDELRVGFHWFLLCCVSASFSI